MDFFNDLRRQAVRVQTVSYITNVLKNPDAAEKLAYVRNYVVYYVVIGEVTEVRRYLYGTGIQTDICKRRK